MKMYSKEDLMNMKNFGADDVDEEDDEDEAQFPSNLVAKKILVGLNVI